MTISPTPPPPRSRRMMLIGVPLAVIVVGGLILLLLARMPFGGEGDKPPRSAAPPPVATAPQPAERGTQATAQPPGKPKVDVRWSKSNTITEENAIAVVKERATSYYSADPGCLGVRSRGYVNDGYTLEVRDQCSNTVLGKWRVDGRTREVFRQREDGRYLKP